MIGSTISEISGVAGPDQRNLAPHASSNGSSEWDSCRCTRMFPAETSPLPLPSDSQVGSDAAENLR